MNNFYDFIFSPFFWLALTVLFSIIELLTSFTLTTIWSAIAAAIMVLLSNAPIPHVVQFAIFLAISIVLLIFTRPLVIKKLNIGKVKTNVDSLVGLESIVLKKITGYEMGDVKINGLLWSATEQTGGTIEVGEKCVIVEVKGAHLVVKKCN
ncbi:MAG: NfeD family protein [Termitinemataceae bacterium]|nr:MAG: NfeD family protein [Termitinemataceae bacterium]